MRTLLLLLVVAVSCAGNHLDMHTLIDIMKEQEVLESTDKRHGSPPESKRHGSPPEAKRHGSPPETKRHSSPPEAKRHGTPSEAKRHGSPTEVKRHGSPPEVKRHGSLPEVKRHGSPPEVKRHGSPPEAKRQETTQTSSTTDETTYLTDEQTTSYNPMLGDDESFGYEEAFLFPGSHYLVDMIRKHCESGMAHRMSVNDIIDRVDISQCDFDDIEDVLSLFGRVDDNDGIAMLATRILIKSMLMTRLKCPASVLEMALTKLLLSKKHQFIANDDTTLYTFLEVMAPMVDPALEPFAEDIAMKAALEVHEVLYRDTMDYLWKFGLKDLAYGSHDIYSVLKNHFQQIVENNYSDQFGMQLGSVLSEIQCPSGCEVIQSHLQEIDRFKDEFTMIETDHICLEVMSFLSNYISIALPGHEPTFENNTALDTVCQEIKLVIEESVEEYAKYESFLFTADITDFKSMVENVIPNEEWAVLVEAVNRLGIMDKTRPSCFD